METFVEAVKKEFGVVMENQEKVDRAINGMATSKGRVDGVGLEATPEVILAKYDQLGGYITKDGFKVKNGCFVDSKTKQPVKKPLVLLIRMNGEIIEQVEGESESLEVKVAKQQMKRGERKIVKKGERKIKDE